MEDETCQSTGKRSPLRDEIESRIPIHDLVMIEYWKECRDTIQNLDNIILKYNTQNMTLLSALLAVAGYTYLQDMQYVSVAVATFILIAGIPLFFQCRIYQQLIVRAITTTIAVEDVLLKNLPCEMKLTRNMDVGVSARIQPIIFSAAYIIIMVIAIILIIMYF